VGKFLVASKFEFESVTNKFGADETIIEHLIEFGYPREATLSYLNKNELNNATTAYWLLKMAEERAT